MRKWMLRPVMDELKALGVRKLQASFSGSGDSGDLDELKLKWSSSPKEEHKAKELGATLAWHILEHIDVVSFDNAGCRVWIEADLEKEEATWEVSANREEEVQNLVEVIPLRELLEGIPPELHRAVVEGLSGKRFKFTPEEKAALEKVEEEIGKRINDDPELYQLEVYEDEGVVEVIEVHLEYVEGDSVDFDGEFDLERLAQEELLEELGRT